MKYGTEMKKINKLGKEKYSEVRRARTKADIMLPFHVLTIWIFCVSEKM